MVRQVEQRPVLFSLVRELLRSERLQEFAEALPTRARVSEPALPLLAAGLHEQLGRPLSILVPEDADARDLAEAAGWFIGPERVALLPSRGVRWDSGLQPPPHLVGERARALEVLAAGGLVFVSATALAEGMPPQETRPAPIRIAPGEQPGIEALTEALALAGYERVERAEDRGQFAVRGGLVDVFPTTGREPLRIEFFGDEIEQVRAFSAFTQRALHPVDESIVYPAAERRLDLVEPALRDDEDDAPPTLPRDLVSALPRGVDVVWEIDRGAKRLGGGGTRADRAPRRDGAGAASVRPAVHVRGATARARGTRAERGRERADGVHAYGQPRRRRVPAPRRGAAHREPDAARRRAGARAGRDPPGRAGRALRDLARAARLRVA